MKGHKIEFEIYANSQEEADDAKKAIVGFINELAYNGCAVSGYKISQALRKWRSNMIIRNKVLEYFRPNNAMKEDNDGQQQ